MDDADPTIEIFRILVLKRALRYRWHLRSLGQNVGKIEELEVEVYPQIGQGENLNILWQRDIDELQLLLSVADGVYSDEHTKALVYKLEHIMIKVNKEANHRLPHFHIEYKKEYRASYTIDTLEKLVGEMPKRYEEPMLTWASRYKKSLKLTWDDLQAGKIVNGLILHADED